MPLSTEVGVGLHDVVLDGCKYDLVVYDNLQSQTLNFCSINKHFSKKIEIFTARRYASAVLAVVVCPSVCLSVCPSVCHKPVLYRNGNT